jgi:hypothetical protein
VLLEQVRHYILGLSDEDLLEYCACPDYEPEAIAFAKEEIARRDLLQESLEYSNAVTQWRSRETIRQRRIAPYLRLSCRAKVFAFITGLLPIHGIFRLIEMSERFDKLGQKRRKRELWLFVFCGLATLLLLILFVVLSNQPDKPQLP